MNNNPMFDNIANALTVLLDAVDKIVERVSKVDYTKLIDTFAAIGEYASYLTAIEELQWPLYDMKDKQFRQKIIELHKSNAPSEQINDIVFSLISRDYIENMKQDWLSISTIKQERLPILSEAIELHNLGYYYASTSLLMCQLYGVSADVVSVAKQNQLFLTKDDKEAVAEVFSFDAKYLKTERGQLLQMLFISDINTGTWYSFAKYIKEVILDSSSSTSLWASQPLRNKICHGDQLNFGTKEHSLKAILTIDLLIKLSDELRIYAQQRNEETGDA